MRTLSQQDLNNWIKYECVRQSGKFNMITNWVEVASVLGVSRENYFFILNHYRELKEKSEQWRKKHLIRYYLLCHSVKRTLRKFK